MVTQERPVFDRSLTQDGHVHRFWIAPAERSGWEVLEEHDREVVRRTVYTDWERVERARSVFSFRASALIERGWTES